MNDAVKTCRHEMIVQSASVNYRTAHCQLTALE